jgi:N-acetylglucosaminyldiphosphoundecaprenol N-acetyl-beta-D-mannosaminyltransferase
MIERYDVIGCKISRLNLDNAIKAVLNGIHCGAGGYICFANVHVSVMAHDNPNILAILNGSYITCPDGKPIYWGGKIRGISDIECISGPDFMPAMLLQETNPPLRHFFMGGCVEVLNKLIIRLKAKFPMADIVGWESPPFRDLSPEEDYEIAKKIQNSGADIVWVGLGAPKQEQWMYNHYKILKPAILMGVGAAFDFHAESIKRAPKWIRTVGLEWLFRLLKEPKRLWRRYLITNFLFIIYFLKQRLKQVKNNDKDDLYNQR